MSGCRHKFVYSGLRFADGRRNRPGSGSVTTYYGHAYYCEKCLEARVEPTGAHGWNSYQPRLPDSTPASDSERKLLCGNDA